MRSYFVIGLTSFVGLILSCTASHLTFGHAPDYMESAVIRTLVSSSYDMCHKACLARKHCLSFELTVKMKLCRMLSVDTTTSGVSLVQKPGTIFTEKRNWTVKTLSQSCDDDCVEGDTCSTETDPPTCSPEECYHPSLLDADSVIMGNMKSIGSKILHVCNNTSNRISSVCQSGNVWSPATLQCIDCGTTIPNGQLTDSSNTALGATSEYTCLPGFYADESHVTCQAPGEWGPGKCNPVDCGTTIPNGQLTDSSNTALGATSEYTCLPGFYADESQVTCQAPGECGPGKCNPVDCGTTIPNGQLTDSSNTALGATSEYTCLPGFYADETQVTCQAPGEWGPGKCYPLATGLNGLAFRIISTETTRWWHYDSSVAQKCVTVKWQPLDNHVKFMFEEVNPGLYKFKSVANGAYMFDGGDFLNSLENPDNDYQRFWIYKETDTTYRIITKATGSYVRVDEDQYVSSEQNKKDQFSLYNLEPA